VDGGELLVGIQNPSVGETGDDYADRAGIENG
jgi:hypothetical protein